MSNYTKIGVVGFTLTLLIALFSIYYNPVSTFEGIEWGNHPLETKEYIDELILIQQTKNAKAQKELDESVKAWKILKEIQDEILESHWLQVRKPAQKTIVQDIVSLVIPKVTASETDYLTEMWFTPAQRVLVLQADVRDLDHFVMWFGAIFRQENWWSFVDWKTNFLAWRLKQGMKYKDFKTQLDWWVWAYNKFRFKHDTVSGRLDTSKYCLWDYAWKHDWCPNRRRNVNSFISTYNWNKTVITVSKWTYYYDALAKQKEADVLWKICIDKWYCK